MTFGVGSRAAAFILVVLSVANAVGQKVKVGYDKSVNFSSYTSYTWGEPSAPPTRPILYASVVGWTERILASKGFSSIEKDGDLILVPAGAMEFGLNSKAGTPIIPSYGAQPAAIDGTMWTGASGSKGSAPYVPEGALMLTFVDRKTNRIIWSGTVTQKLDLEKKEKSLKLAEKAVIKLLAKFPPPKRD